MIAWRMFVCSVAMAAGILDNYRMHFQYLDWIFIPRLV